MSEPRDDMRNESTREAAERAGIVERLRAHDEMTSEESPAEMASGGMGLMIAVGLIMGTGIGALLGNAFLDDAFGWGVDFLVGGVIGLVIGALLGYLIVKMMASRV